jgi:hypothetical protein
VTFLLLLGGIWAPGPDEIEDLAGAMTDVRHNMTSRHAAFLLTGDVLFDKRGGGGGFFGERGGDLSGAKGAPAFGLEIPFRMPDADDITVSIRAFDPVKWTSFRTHDRGACSVFLSWDQFATALADNIAREVGEDDRAHGVSWAAASLRPKLQSRPHPDLGGFAVVNTDAFFFSMRIGADQFGPFGPCIDFRATVEVDVVIEATPFAFFQIPAVSFRFVGVPAYAADDFWRGGRHKCMKRDSSQGAVAAFGNTLVRDLIDALPDIDVCHVRLEPKGIFARPDGLEVVFLNERDGEPQSAFFSEGGLIDGFTDVCVAGRAPSIQDGNPTLRGSEDGLFSVMGPGF